MLKNTFKKHTYFYLFTLYFFLFTNSLLSISLISIRLPSLKLCNFLNRILIAFILFILNDSAHDKNLDLSM